MPESADQHELRKKVRQAETAANAMWFSAKASAVRHSPMALCSLTGHGVSSAFQHQLIFPPVNGFQPVAARAAHAVAPRWASGSKKKSAFVPVGSIDKPVVTLALRVA